MPFIEVYNILEQISNVGGKNDKESILMSHKGNALLQECFRLAYSPTVQFYIKNIRDGWQHINEYPTVTTDVLDVLTHIRTRQSTGNAAMGLLVDTLSSIDYRAADVVCRIIKKDLRCGVGQSTINKVWKDLIVTPARKGAVSMSEKALSKIKFPAAVELKSDGSYCASVCGGNDVTMMSRNGNPITGMTLLENELSHPAFDDFALEGELVYDLTKGTRKFGNGIIGKVIKGTATQEECEGVYYQVWDCIHVSEYKPKGEYKLTNTQRRTLLEDMVRESGCERIKLIPRTIVNSFDEANSVFEGYVRAGFEGAILKQLNTYWVDNPKPVDCVKMKRKESADLEIVGMYEGEGKAAGKLGGLLLESDCGGIKVSCGSGFSDEQREILWNDKSTVGKVVEVEYDSITQDKKTGQHSMFLPIFKGVRVDKMVADTKADIESKQKLK